MCDKKIFALHIMLRHNVYFCENELRWMPQTIFHLNLTLLLMIRIYNIFYFLC